MSQESALIPRFSATQATRLALDFYGLEVAARPLASFCDQNFCLVGPGGERWVLKISNGAFSQELIEAQGSALRHLAAQPELASCVPTVYPTLAGDWLASAQATIEECKTGADCAETGRHWIHLLSYQPGRPMADVKPWERDLLRGAGRLVAAVDVGLGSFDHPAIHRHMAWDLKNVLELRRLCPPLLPRQRYLAERCLDNFAELVLPRLPELPESAIHNDGNGDNILLRQVDGAHRANTYQVTGLIDFGELIHTHRIFGLAIAAAYATLKQPDPLAAAEEICVGYHRLLPVSGAELDVLFSCIQCRLVTSVVIVADELRQRRARGLPDDPYLVSNSQPGWQALEELASVPTAEARGRLARACGQ